MIGVQLSFGDPDDSSAEGPDQLMLVRHHDHGSASSVYRHKHFHYLKRKLRVDIARRFVGYQYLGLIDKSSCKADTLLFSSRKLPRASVFRSLKSDYFKNGCNSLSDCFFRLSDSSHRKGYIIKHVHFVN